MDTDKVIEMLRQDMRGEHQAIIQYLNHAYRMGNEELACEIEAIAREEMRHLDWLADAITELGGDPSMERDEPDLSHASAPDQMAKNVDLEQVAIDQYRAHIEAIPDEGIRRMLARIVHDEQVHKEQFAGLQDEAREWLESLPDGEAEETPQKPAQRLVDILNQGIRHEYTVVLQYLFHSFMAEDKEAAEELQNAAINEMQHMGWLSEELAERDVAPQMDHSKLFLSDDLEANLEADIAVEQEVTRDYSAQLAEIDVDDIHALVTRIRDHEIYHDARFKDLLAEVREHAQASAEPCEPGTEASSPEAAPEPTEPAKSETLPDPPVIGSLVDEPSDNS